MGLLALAAAAFLVAIVARLFVVGLFNVRDRFFKPPMSKGVRRTFRRATAFLAAAWTGMALATLLMLGGWMHSTLHKTFLGLEAIGFIFVACGIWDMIAEDISARVAGHSKRAERLLVPLASKLIRALIIGVGALIMIAELTEVSLPALLASLGLGSVVLALAAKDSVENIFGSLTILFDMPFALGDWVKIGAIEGVVEEINLRSTRIRTFEDTIVNLPNANLIRTAVENYGARRVRRQRMLLRVNPDNSEAAIGKFVEKLDKYLKTKKEVLADKAVVALDSFDDISLAVLVQCHFEADDYPTEMRLRDELLRTALKYRDECGVLLASEARSAREARLNPPTAKPKSDS
jgi:MscS family membrane protein